MSPREFRDRFIPLLIEIHWRQWAALGVSSNITPETKRVIDLEGLIASTIVTGLLDRRLLSVSLEWLIENGEWVSFSRLRRIGRVFTKPLSKDGDPVLGKDHFKLLADTIRRFGRRAFNVDRWSLEPGSSFLPKEYEEAFSAFRMRGVVKAPNIRHPSLLQLLARSIFGLDARAESFVYLLLNRGGNSNSIAKAMYCEQKSIYRVLEKWKRAGLVEKGDRYYSLRKREDWLGLLGFEERPLGLNWIVAYLTFGELTRKLSDRVWIDDQYLLSSLFRDRVRQVSSLGESLRVEIPDPSLHLGGAYFEPFAAAILEVLQRLAYPTPGFQGD